MNATKQAERKTVNVRRWNPNIAIVVFYIICYVLIVFIGIKNSSPIVDSEKKDVLRIIWESLGNAGTLIPLLVTPVSALILKWQHKRLSNLCIFIISTVGFFLYCFYNILVKCPIHPVIVAIVGLSTYVVSIILVLLRPSNIAIKQSSIIRSAIGNRIKNAQISGIQIFECTMTEKDDNINYSIHSIDHLSNDDSDINGMLSATYQLKKKDVNGFDFVTKTNYQALIESANDSIKDELIKLIEERCVEIKARLQRIEVPSDVTKDDCCLARLMIMYKAYLSILKPIGSGSPSVPDAYIGEYDLRDGELGVDVEIQERLFALVRTGLLGGVLVGPNCIYHFHYRKDGYKAGRQYCVFHLNEQGSANKNHIFLCLIVIKEGNTKSIPPYVLQAIRKIIMALEESLHKAVQEVNS